VQVVPEVRGRVEQVFVKEGDRVKAGQELGKIDTRQIDSDLEGVRKQKLSAILEAQAQRGNGREAEAQIADKRSEAHAIQEAKLLADIADGVVMTKDIELRQGVFMDAGTEFAVIGTLDAWDMLVHLNEKQIGRVEALHADKGTVPVDFILYSHNTYELNAPFKDRSQLSQLAYPHERESAMKENAFILTLPNVELPPEIRGAMRPDLTGRASIKLGRKPLVLIWGTSIAQWFRLKWIW
jgi:pyruvate/2-oxoglutarate dehydrogenase complex dihydrolipoamide acyltransferase (E2) component